ncbi:DUF6090 family protein [Muriicola sp. E247]|uniref:DUF6090 family protein n=1 Tax=Muriicola sp. E247 TaxID=3242730 RepID=UPI003523DA0E
MIKFFRLIRQHLLAENKFGKYVLYAIGEIALVVIGILIALSVNNNNELRKLQQLETKSLQELKRALELDLSDINYNAKRHKNAQLSAEIVLEALNTDHPYHDSLSIHFERSTNITVFLPNLGPYETLKARGLDLIENDSLRNEISKYYEQDIKYAFVFEDANIQGWPMKFELILDHFDEFKMFNSATPVDFEKLKNDRRFISYIKLTSNLRGIESNVYANRMHNSCSKLIELIEKEITKG